MRVAEAIRDGRPDPEGLRAAQETARMVCVECPSVTSIADKVANEVQKLRGEGLAAHEIAVISLRGLSAKESVLHSSALAAHAPVRADDAAIEEHVVADTFLRFKGLERPAVVIVDLHLVEGDLAVRLFIALTRALTTARVVSTREALAALAAS
jgi:superfamily I DNA and RNA helicase